MDLDKKLKDVEENLQKKVDDIIVNGLSKAAKYKLEDSKDEKMSKETKTCQFCGEKILAAAIKCKHCGSMADERQDPSLDEPLTDCTKETKC